MRASLRSSRLAGPSSLPMRPRIGLRPLVSIRGRVLCGAEPENAPAATSESPPAVRVPSPAAPAGVASAAAPSPTPFQRLKSLAEKITGTHPDLWAAKVGADVKINCHFACLHTNMILCDNCFLVSFLAPALR
jgi:hypothetical protein